MKKTFIAAALIIVAGCAPKKAQEQPAEVKAALAIIQKTAKATAVIAAFGFEGKPQLMAMYSGDLVAAGRNAGADVREALVTPGTNDYYGKMKSALSHANAAAYWLELLYESDYIDQKIFEGIFADCQEIIKTLVGLFIGRENVVSH